MIEGYCRTNLDEYKREEWPTVFVAVPRVGEWVQSKSNKILKVCRVVHKIKYVPRYGLEIEGAGNTVELPIPIIEVELNK